MSYFEVVASALFFQFSLYACVRVAHHGFTFGELSLVAFGATVLFMELVNLTKAKVRARRFVCRHRHRTPITFSDMRLYGAGRASR